MHFTMVTERLAVGTENERSGDFGAVSDDYRSTTRETD